VEPRGLKILLIKILPITSEKKLFLKNEPHLSKIFITNLPNFAERHLREREKIHCFLCSGRGLQISNNTDVFL